MRSIIEYSILNPTPRELLLDGVPIESLTNYFNEVAGIDYDAIYSATVSNYRALQFKFAKWSCEDFDGVVTEVGDRRLVYAPFSSVLVENRPSEAEVKGFSNSDKLILQNYGRPYSTTEQPCGSFYSFPKEPSDINQWHQ